MATIYERLTEPTWTSPPASSTRRERSQTLEGLIVGVPLSALLWVGIGLAILRG